MTAFATVWRTFVDQFFSSELVTSDVRLRQRIVWVMAFLHPTRRDGIGRHALAGSTIVLAKLAALAAFLGAAHLGINLTTGLLFSVGVAGSVGRFPVRQQLLVTG